MNPEITKIIEQYLNGELSESDKVAFEKKMSENEALRQEVDFHRQIHEAAKRLAIKSNIANTAKNFHLLRKLMIAGVVTLTLAIATGIYYVVKNNTKQTEISLDEQKELEKMLNAQAPIDLLPTQYFQWKGNDTVFVSPKGVLISVPQNAFLKNGKAYKDPILIQYQEAVDVAEIVKSGLSTMSGDQLLETQGMFGLKAFTTDKKRLDVNPNVGVYMQVPVDELKTGMMLFEGKETTNGTIDWQNPKKLQKLPTLAKMKDLNFYPPHYEDSLNKMKQRTDKKYRDSLYLSMEEFLDEGPKEVDLIVNGVSSIENKIKNEGQLLFDSKCATCHNPHKNGTGPKLFEIRKIWNAESEIEGIIYEYLNDWQKAYAESDYVKFISRRTPSAHINFKELTSKQANQIFDYIDGIKPEKILTDSISNETKQLAIPPSKVLAFWNPKFDNTNLATRDFEKRMQAIHKTCDPKVLALYTKNLNLSLAEIDAMVVKMGYKEFQKFVDENVGKVNFVAASGGELNNKHLENISSYYEKTISELRKEAKSIEKLRLQKEQKWDQKTQDSRSKENLRSNDRNVKNFNQELEHNTESVYKQLGKKRPEYSNTVGFTITSNVAVYNIDKFVFDQTISRTSGKYFDKDSGKTAKLVYNKMKLKVENMKSYQRVFVYLFPSKLNSFHRLNPENGMFEYALNGEFQYDLAIVAYKDDGYYFYSKKYVTGTDLGTISLTKVSEEKLNNSLESMNHSRYLKEDDISDELKWILQEKQDYVVQKKRVDQQKFRLRIAKIVFPCMSLGQEYVPEGEGSEDITL